MKSLISTVLASTIILTSSNSFAAKPLTESEAVGQCRALASTQFNNVKKVRIAHIKSTRGQFKAKLRVKSATEKGMFLCTIERNQEAQIVRLDKDTATVAKK